MTDRRFVDALRSEEALTQCCQIHLEVRYPRQQANRKSLRSMNVRRILVLTLVGVVALFLMWLYIELLGEAYGSGPPYFGRTTNMDKWSNPLPSLLMVDAIATVLLGMMSYWVLRCKP